MNLPSKLTIKWIFGITLILLFGLFLSPVFLELEEFSGNDKELEISKSKIQGYKNGKKNWEVHADYLWTGRSSYLFRARDIQEGKLFDYDGTIILDNLKASNAKINTRSKTIHANGQVSANFHPRKNKKISKGLIASQNTHLVGDDEKINIKADNFKFFSISNKTYLTDNVTIQKNKTLIFPKEGVWVDIKENIAFIENGLTIDHDGFIVSADAMTIYIDEKYSVIKNNIRGHRPATQSVDENLDEREIQLKKNDTYLSCDQMRYSQKDDTKIVELFGNVKIFQDDKSITGKKAIYNEDTGEFQVEDDVKFKSTNLKWLLSPSKKSEVKGDKTKESIESETSITCKKLTFNSQTKELVLFGDVVIVQPDKTITCDHLKMDDAIGWIFLSGKVSIEKDDNDTLNCDFVSVDIENEVFFASRNVSTEFFIDKE